MLQEIAFHSLQIDIRPAIPFIAAMSGEKKRRDDIRQAVLLYCERCVLQRLR